MKQRNLKHEKRLKKLVLTCLLLAVVLTVGTYAWFIGMQTVSVNAFEVKIAAADGLALSVTGEKDSFSDNVTINAEELAEIQKNSLMYTMATRRMSNIITEMKTVLNVGK